MPDNQDDSQRGRARVDAGRRDEIALCMSGGGYRAMLFHVGALRRLNEFGLLGRVKRFSTVSGGSIAAAVLGTEWGHLEFADGMASNFDRVSDRVFDIADRTIDVRSAVAGVLLPGTSPAKQLERRYRRVFGRATLQDLPDSPRFVFNTTNMETGNAFRWSRPYAADYSVGKIEHPRVNLSAVVAASSAFPPFLSPLRLDLPGQIIDWDTGSPVDPQPEELWLTDGGVYDNLGLETAKSFSVVLASDGGAPLDYNVKLRGNLISGGLRTIPLLNAQAAKLRRRQLVAEFEAGQRGGTLWTIKTDMRSYPAPDTLDCPLELTKQLADVSTRLRRMPDSLKHRIANWGYASADAAIRSYVDAELPAADGFPWAGGVG